ncbi:MAG TPA: hypothetical protein VHZ77_01320 [Gaiellaceae bacterium]|nr:hypothetical protein [Gaiellaceae bacterium]
MPLKLTARKTDSRDMNNYVNLLGTRVFLLLSSRSVSELRREEGQTLAEYGLVVALIAAALVAIIAVIAGSVTGLFNRSSSAI